MRRRAYVAMGIMAVLAVGACSHDSSGGKSALGAAAEHRQDAAGAALAPRPALDQTARGTSLMGTASGARPVNGSASHSSVTLPLDDGTFKIRTAEMTVAIKGWRNIAAKADAAIGIAERVGGEVDADDRTSGRYATATLRLRIPPEALQDTLSALGKLGIEKTRQLSTTDVTERVADVNSRAASARESIARLRALYASAKKVTDVIAIESELGRREADLESLEAQQRSLSRQTSMAAITLGLVTAAKPVAKPDKPEKKHGGFLGGLERGWDGFTAAAVWIAAAVGTILPFLLLGLVLAFAVRVLWPRLPHRPTPAPAPSE
jgi:hypothetical protein